MDSDDMNNGNDGTDFWRLKFKSKKKQTSETETKEATGTASNNILPVIHGDFDSDAYSMQHPLGMCLIFNHRYFNEEEERKATDKDANRLYNTFRKLGFDEVKIFNNFSVREVKEELEKAAKADHSKNSCFVCCILTHGDTQDLCARDGKYPISLLYDIFNGSDEASRKLRGKPKLFFIQACQGDGTDSGVNVISGESLDNLKKIPTYTDFLIVRSSFPGFVSFSNVYTGSYFINYLCEVLTEHAKDKHLMDMLTIVTRKVAFYFESSSTDSERDKKKQVPYIKSTLTKYVKFPPKLPEIQS